MKILKIILLILTSLALNISVYSQDNNTTPERTPEQEAAKQTEKLQQELDLTAEQARQIHDINLKYARARKASNTRSDALQRIKDKEAELKKILNPNQYTQLQNKRYERSSFQTPSGTRNLPVNPSGFRPAPNSRAQQISRDQQANPNVRSDNRPNNSGTEIRRTQQPIYREGTVRQNPTATQPRTSNPQTQQSAPATRNQSTPATNSGSRSSGSSSPSSSGGSSGTTAPTRSSGSSDGSGTRSSSGSSTTNRR